VKSRVARGRSSLKEYFENQGPENHQKRLTGAQAHTAILNELNRLDPKAV
jgi:hypothetical protein